MKKSLCLFYAAALCAMGSICVAAGYPAEVRNTLSKAGGNATELEKVLKHYRDDPQKLKAAYFLVANMDCHASQSYYWTDGQKQRVAFNEADYPTYEQAVEAFNKLSAGKKLTPVRYTTPDITAVKAEYLIRNIDDAFAAWKSNWSSNLPFELFCEYLLPYRIMNEPFDEWRESYRKTFSRSFDQCAGMRVREVCTYLVRNHRDWFSNIFSYQLKREPQDVLSPRQILFRQQGYCEDIANWGVYMLRSMGIAACVDYTPYWATTGGGHFWHTAFNERGEEIPFFMGDDTPAEFFMRREPSKVLRLTYSKQKEVPLSYVPEEKVPEGFLRRKSFIDVTDQYWKTASLPATLFPAHAGEKLGYLAVLNAAKWRIAWWAKTAAGKVTFDKMSCGVVYLPMVYKDGKEIPAADPCLLTPQGDVRVLKADKTKTQTVHIEQKTDYLIFRPNANYTLCYWDSTGQWAKIGTQAAGAAITPGMHLHFEGAPTNALFVLIPEYSKGLERPFTLDENGKMNWW